ncbi:hypothetical protein IFM89_003055 [Coptis chinensis]|uniref:Acyl-[acyl-carrier-protein] hydrolase n=1 Tax=Coptis chinensis TaxID=261450 RepID=A0A835MH24_9MAGN|nr:hypothetical protein IFM89_003055 [Coptis chinensis]
MASLACYVSFAPIRCSSNRDNNPNNQQLNSMKINGTSAMSTTKIEGLTQSSTGLGTTLVAVTSRAETEYNTNTKEQTRQNIPTEKQLVDPYRQGLIIDNGVGYRQTVVIRSYEVGADKTATLESILNLLQETALNHVWMSGLLSDGFGATHGMMKNDLIWVVTRLQVQVDSYPIWGEVLEVDTWVGASGKNGMRRDWVIRSHETGHVFARGTSTWVMMNQKTRRLSKMPEEVRGEISPWFITKKAIPHDASLKIKKLDDKAKYVTTNLKPKRSDLDMNHHVNNVKYVRWMLETIPDKYLESHQLSSITLEYRRECGRADIVQSLCDPEEDEVQQGNDINILNGFSLPSDILVGRGLMGSFDMGPMKFTHLLQIKGERENEEIVRGRTTWKRKISTIPFSI